MDENSPAAPPSNSEKTAIQHADRSNTLTVDELKATDLDSTTSSPRRPLSDTTIPSMNKSQQKPTPGKDTHLDDKQFHLDLTTNHETYCLSAPTSPRYARKQRPRDQQRTLDIYNDNEDGADGDKEKFLRSSVDLHKSGHTRVINPKPLDTTMIAAIGAATAAAEAVTVTASNSNTQKPPPVDDRTSVDDLKTQVTDLIATLAAERKKSTLLATWKKDIGRLVQHFKDIRDDVMDSVEILAEFEQVTLAFEREQQQQAEVDRLMNRVAERLFEVEEARQQLIK